MKFGIWVSWKSVKKIQVLLKSKRITGSLQEDQYTFLIVSCTVLRMRNVSDKSCRENQNTHIVFNDFFFFKKTLCSFWDNVEKYGRLGRPQMTIWHMHIPCWVPKATNTPSECVILNCFSTAIMVAQMCLNVILYVYCLSYLPFVLRCISMLCFIFHHFYFLHGTVAFYYFVFTIKKQSLWSGIMLWDLMLCS